MKKMTQQQLHSLIERYFNAETSQAEEQQLRTYLANGKYAFTAEVEDALAVMSVQRRSRRQSSRFIAPLSRVAAAAVVGVIAVIGVHQFTAGGTHAESYAYVGGKYTEDTKVLNKIMASQLSDLANQMQQSQDAFDDQLSDLSEAMQQYENK
jgi:hypothetical protein